MSEELRNALKTGLVKVSFVKHNGEPRVLVGTLNEKYLPTPEDTGTKTKRKEDVIAVWDTEQNGWRSFRFDSVTSWEPVTEAKPVKETSIKTRPSVSE